jgi:hypothetical protein
VARPVSGETHQAGRSRHGSASFFALVECGFASGSSSNDTFLAASGDNLPTRFAITTCAAGNLSGISGAGDVDPRTPRIVVLDAVQTLRAPRMLLSGSHSRRRALKIGFKAPANPGLAFPLSYGADMTPKDDGQDGSIDARPRARESAAMSWRPSLRLQSLSPCRSCSA